MKILVTGGAGFIGTNFVYYWLNTHPDDEVLVLDKLTYAGRKANLTDALKTQRVTFFKGDICDQKIVDRLVAQVNTVVHFAAESHVDRSIADPTTFAKTNVLGTLVLLEAARKYQVRFHHVSTDEVYGSLERNSRERFEETRAYDPRSPYAASKAGSDHLALSYATTFGLNVTVSNCSNNYGPWQNNEKLIPKIITNLLCDKKVPIYGDGGQLRDWLHVEDHCRAIDLILQKGKTGDRFVIGGGSKEITNLDMAKMIIKYMGADESVIEFVEDRKGHDQKYSVNFSKIKKLGYKPLVTLESGIMQTIDWYRANREFWQ
jgi:dTDP-glucose 4,6-dehydratase